MVLRQILLHPPAYVMPEPQMLIPFSRQKFDAETGDLVDEETRERLRRFLSALVEWTQRFEDPMKASPETGSRGESLMAATAADFRSSQAPQRCSEPVGCLSLDRCS